MSHMLAEDNLALISLKQHKNEFGALATRYISAHKSVAAYDIDLDDIRTYCGMVTAIAVKLRIQDEIDNSYPETEKGLV